MKKMIKDNPKMSWPYEESDAYVDQLVQRATEQAIKVQRLHERRMSQRRTILAAAATVLVLVCIGGGFLFHSAGIQTQEPPAVSGKTHEQTDRTTTAKIQDGDTNPGQTDSQVSGETGKSTQATRLTARHEAKSTEESQLDRVLNHLNDEDMAYVDSYEIEDIPEY